MLFAGQARLIEYLSRLGLEHDDGWRELPRLFLFVSELAACIRSVTRGVARVSLFYVALHDLADVLTISVSNRLLRETGSTG